MRRTVVTLIFTTIIVGLLGIVAVGAATLEEIQAPPSLPSLETEPPPLKTPLPSPDPGLPSLDTPLPSMDSGAPPLKTPLPSLDSGPRPVDTTLPPAKSGPTEPTPPSAQEFQPG